MSTASSSTGRRGRPRKTGRTPENPRAEILRAAGRLFAVQGYEGTSTGEIADAVGLTQPAIFYYFDSKEVLFQELANRSVDEPLARIEAVLKTDAPAAVKLYNQIVYHCVYALNSRFSIAAVADDITRLAGSGGFEDYFRKADQYTGHLRKLVRDGVDANQFLDNDTFVTTMAILGMSGWSLRWYDPEGRMSPEDVGHAFADFTMRSLLRSVRSLPKIRRQSDDLEVTVESPKPAQTA